MRLVLKIFYLCLTFVDCYKLNGDHKILRRNLLSSTLLKKSD